MKSLRFIIGVIFTSVLACIIYFVVVDQYIIYEKEAQGSSYRLSLLESLSDYQGKVVIIGASDAHHGVNAERLEELLNRPVINFGRNANIPYDQQIYSIKRYLQKGDIVVADMFWPYLLSNHYITSAYVSTLMDNNSYHFYYKNLPLFKRIVLVFTDIPYHNVIRVVFSRPDKNSRIKYQLDFATTALKRVEMGFIGVRGSSMLEVNIEELIDDVAGSTCDQFLVSNFTTKPVDEVYPSEAAVDTIQQLKSLENMGVTVLFSWGFAVTRPGTEQCYETADAKGLDIFAERVRKILNDNEIPILGDYYDYRYPEECFLDSPAHIKRSCSENVAQTLYENGLNQYVNKTNTINSKEITNAVLESIRLAIDEYTAQYLRTVSPNQLIAVGEFDKYLYLDEGWSGLEENGVWTEGGGSKITLKYLPSNTAIGLHFKGRYFNGDEKTKVIINGVETGYFVLKDKTVVLPEGMNESEMLTIELQHESPVSLQGLDSVSTDDRKVKYKLQGISLVELVANPLSNGQVIVVDEF